MPVTGKFQDYSKEQLISELQELHVKYSELSTSYQKDISDKKHIEANLLSRTEYLSAFNQYSIDLINLDGPEMYKFVVSRFKDLFRVGVVWISIYNEENSELIIVASTANDEESSLIIKLLGKAMHSYRTPVDEASYNLMIENHVKSYATLTELSFGQIPEIIGSAIQKVMKIGWFQGISLVDKEKLYGTMVVAGYKDQEIPSPDIIKLFSDLTSNIIRRKQSEYRLHLSEDKFKKAFITSPDSLNINRLSDGKYVSINHGFTKMSGYIESEVLGKTSLELNIWANISDREKLVKGLTENGVVDNLEAVFIKKNGSLMSGLMSASIIDLDGVPHVLSITRDISDKKEAELALRKSELKYRELIELAVDGILIGSSDGTIIGANSYMLTLTKRALSDILGMHISDLFESESLIKSPLRFDLLSKGETVINERNIILPDKSLVPIEMHTKLMPDGTYQSIYHDTSERKKAEQALRSGEEKLQSIIRVAPVGIGLVADRKLIEVNDELCRLVGYDRSELIGKSSSVLYISKEEYERVGKIKYDLIALHGTGSVETIFKSKDNSQLNVILSSTPIDRNDHSKGVTFTVLDITERKKAESSLRESEEKFRSIAENLSDVIFITDMNGIVNYISPAARNFGYEPDQYTGKYFGDFLAPCEVEKAMNHFFEVIKGQVESASISLIVRRADGTEFYAEVSGSLFKIGNENYGALGLIRDITKQKNLESATLESEKRYRELFLNNPLPTYIFDSETLEFIEANDALCDNYGYTREEFASMTLRDIRIIDDDSSFLKSLNELGEDDFHSSKVFHKKKDGTVFPVEVISHSLPVKNGRKTRLVLVSDISERIKAAEQMKLAKEKAEASDKLKTSFLNNISHEVRTPLNGILGFAELISQKDLSEADRAEAVSMVHESSDRLLKTITNYMDISLLTSGSIVLNKKSFRSSDMVKDIYERFLSSCRVRHLDLILEIPENGKALMINTDPELTDKILCHFMDNAIKFTASGKISLGYDLTGQSLEFFVKDTGIGIKEKSLDNIFNRFVKEEVVRDKVSEGSGLGLTIAKAMAELIGGTIKVISEPGKGSEFSLVIELSDNGSDKLKHIQRFIPENRSGKNTILIAEDDETNFFYMNALLSRETDLKIIHAENGRKAVELFKSNNDIKLILMDIKMPELDGLEATRQIKLIDPDIPILAITAYAMSGDEERVMAAGCDGYLSKPIRKESLLKKIAELVKVASC